MQVALQEVFPAAVLLVICRGGVILQKAYGFLDPDTRRQPAQIDTLFDLASLTKLFTATGFMRLVEAGRVGLETPVGEVIAEFNGQRRIGPTEDPLLKIEIPAEARYAGRVVNLDQITFRHLLTHTSGLAAWRSTYLAGPDAGGVPLPHQVPANVRTRRITAVSAYDFAYPPGERVVYSDLGFILLGEAIARLSGMGLETFVHQSVLQPLGLQYTVFNPLAKNISPNEIAPTGVCAWRKRRLVGEVDDENAAGLGGIAGHAGLFSTAGEVARLGILYLNQGQYGGHKLLDPEIVREMTRQQVYLYGLRRGLAWVLWTPQDCSCGTRFGQYSFGHTGFTGASLWIDPDRDLLVVALTNRVYHGRENTAILGFRPLLHNLVIEALR